jgi:hypothetical protein
LGAESDTQRTLNVTMPNKRFAETQEDGALLQARRDNLKVTGFTKVDGELYHEA